MLRFTKQWLPAALLFGSFPLTCCAHDSSLPTVESQFENWKSFIVSLHAARSKNIFSGTVIVYPDSSSVAYDIKYPEVALDLKSEHPVRQALFSPETVNPFVKLFPEYYMPAAQEKYSSCNFIGMGFELDDNPATQEWLVSLAGERCLFGSEGFLGAGNSDFHHWLIQKEPTGRYRILLESEGRFKVIDKGSGYKALGSTTFIEHVFRQEASKNPEFVLNKQTVAVCGEAQIEWHFQGGRYMPVEMIPNYQSCEAYYHPSNYDETEEDFIFRTYRDVIRRSQHWLKQATGQCYDYYHLDYTIKPAACPGRFIKREEYNFSPSLSGAFQDK